MKVTGTQTTNVEIKLDKTTIDTIVKTQLLGLVDLSKYANTRYSGVYLDGNAVMKWEEDGGGSHSWIDKEKIRDATDLDIRVFTILDDLKNVSR